MATLNFPDDPSTGDIYTDGNSGFTYEWNGTVWISKDPSTVSNIREIDDISSGFDGSDTTFTLQVAGVNVEPANVQQLIISVGGVMQNAGQDFTVSGSTLTFTTAPSSSLTFFGVLLGTALSLNTIADGSVVRASLSTTTNYMMGGLTVDQSAGIITAYQFKGDGSGLTGVASTDNIVTSTDAYFGANVAIGGSLTVQGTETIINVEELNVQDKTVGIASTNAPTATTQDGAGAIIYGQTHINILYDVDKAALGISTGVNVSGFLTATRAQVGTGVTINNTGIDIGVGGVGVVTTGNVTGASATITSAVVGSGVTINNTGIDAGIGAGIITASAYYGSGANLTGVGVTATVIATDPLQGSTVFSASTPTQIALSVNQGIKAGNADKNIDLRSDSLTGNIVESFGVGSSVTYSLGQAIIQPSGIGVTNETTYFVVAPDGAFETVGGASSTGIVNSYSFVTKDFDRELFGAGIQYSGVLGNFSQGGVDYSSPIQIFGPELGWRDISVSKGLTNSVLFGVKVNNTLWSWGKSSNGCLGHNDNTSKSSPVQVPGTTWKDVTSQGYSSWATKTDGTMWSWGNNQQGQLGHNNKSSYSSPKQIGSDNTWSRFAASGTPQNRVCVAVKTDGTLWSWGGKNYGGGLGHNENGANTEYSSPKQIGAETDWVSCSMGREGNVFASKNTSASAGRYLDKQGELWCWGTNQGGELCTGNTNSVSSPTQIPGTTWDCPRINYGCGTNTVFLTKSNGSLWVWGRGDNGRTGTNQPDGTHYSSPKQVGTRTDWASNRALCSGDEGCSGALNESGGFFTWGKNDYGQGMRNVPTSTERSSPVQVGGGGYVNLQIGKYSSFVVTKKAQ